MIERDEDKLAMVVAHEVAHCAARHHFESLGLTIFLFQVSNALCNGITRLFVHCSKTLLCALFPKICLAWAAVLPFLGCVLYVLL